MLLNAEISHNNNFAEGSFESSIMKLRKLFRMLLYLSMWIYNESTIINNIVQRISQRIFDHDIIGCNGTKQLSKCFFFFRLWNRSIKYSWRGFFITASIVHDK